MLTEKVRRDNFALIVSSLFNDYPSEIKFYLVENCCVKKCVKAASSFSCST